MPTAIERIVNAYVTMANQAALEDLLAHRERLLNDMNGRSGFDFRLALNEIGAEVRAISAGLDCLKSRNGLTSAEITEIAPAVRAPSILPQLAETTLAA